MPDDPRLSQDELVSVLQRAAEREAREGPRRFSPADVVQAGRELGLGADSVEAELRQLAVRRSRLGELDRRHRPFDTRITVESEPGRFLVQVPPRGPHVAALGMLGFGAAVLTFVAYWTYTAVSMGAPAAFTAFSLPFWLVGAGMLGGALRSMVSTERLELDRDQGVLTSRPLGRTLRLRTAELAVRLDRLKQRRGQHAPPAEIPALALDHGTRTHHMMASFSEAEQRWVKAELDHWLAG